MRFEHFVIRPSRSRARNDDIAGWSSLEARRAHNPEAVGSNPTPATTKEHAIMHVLFILSYLLSYVIHITKRKQYSL